jgi:hypothetical protein
MVDFKKVVSLEARKKLGPDRTKEAFDLSLSLWFLRPCMDECDAERSRHMLHMM